MNKSAFLKLIKQVSDISDQQQTELEQVAAAFPYCQTAHLLLAKSAYDKGSMLSTQRLRRASAYATDRQLLKRLIYATPVLEAAYIGDDEAPVEEETVAIAEDTAIPEEESTVAQFGAVEAETAIAIPEAEDDEQEETLEQVYSPAPVEQHAYLDEADTEVDTETPDPEIDSELALLFTFNSISSSSTDLLIHREDESIEEAEQKTEQAYLTETAEALHDLEAAHDVAEIVTEAEQPEETGNDELAIPSEHEELPQGNLTDEVATPESSAEDTDLYADETEESAKTNPEDAEINYSFDEIDRLYAEDALGYWMGSSRLGEVLQLKDDYTRERPQSFHPELILEYSKTHELEKAIQPTAHVLSRQLDIIDQFLKLNPKLKTMANLKLKPEPQEDLSLKSSKIKKGMATESLANIFIQQGKPKKAVKIYEQLILKYPEKKSYFAEQIEKLQNIT